MCASSPTDLSALAKKGAKKTKAALKAFKLPTTAKEAEDTLQDMISHLPLADAVIMVAGFYAGMKGYTPFTALLKTMQTLGGGVGDILGLGWSAATLNVEEYFKKLKEMTEGDKPPIQPFSDMIALGCAGMIEAYMITRPGALQATLGFVSGMAQAAGEIIPL